MTRRNALPTLRSLPVADAAAWLRPDAGPAEQRSSFDVAWLRLRLHAAQGQPRAAQRVQRPGLPPAPMLARRSD